MLAPCLTLYEQISLPVAGLCTVTFFPVTFFSYLPTVSFFSCHFIHTATQMNCYLFPVSFFPLVHCYFLSCYFFPTWNCYFLSCFFFPTCALLLFFLLLFFLLLFSYMKLLLSFLFLFFPLVHCYFFSCYFFSCYFFPTWNCYFLSYFFFSHLCTVTFFPVTFFPVTFFLHETVTFFPVSFFPTCALLPFFLLLSFRAPNKITNTLKTTFLNAILRMKSVVLWFVFHWSWFLRVQLPLIDSLSIGSCNVTIPELMMV